MTMSQAMPRAYARRADEANRTNVSQALLASPRRRRGSVACAMSSIYLQQGGHLVEMREREYAAERILQRLLADHPELLSDDEDGTLLLVRREAALSDPVERASAGWLDHLFLDRHAVPTLVEVKRKSDARLRRDVVG